MSMPSIIPKVFLLRKIFLLGLLTLFNASFSSQLHTHSKIWGSAVFIGELIKDTKVKYYLEPQLRFIDNRYKFEESLLYAGLGFQTLPSVTLFLGGAWMTAKMSNGNLLHQNRIWQQANWTPIEKSYVSLISRTRLEERKNQAESQWAVRFRERLMLRMPFKNLEKHSLVLFDEFFFNLNHPEWIGNMHSFAQNRIFIGIGNKVSKQTSFDMGYLNQYHFTIPNQMGHVILISLTVNR